MTENSNEIMKTFGRLIRNPIIFTTMNPHRRNRHHHNKIAPIGQMRVIHLLSKEGELSAGDISEILDIRPSSATALIDKLVEKDLVERMIDKRDKRVKVIKLTKLGKQIVNDNESVRDELGEKMFAGLSKKELGELDRMLNIVADNASKVDLSDYIKRQTMDSIDDYFPDGFGPSGFKFRR